MLRDLEAQLTFDETTLTLSDLNAHVGGGRVRGKGTVDVADVNNPIIDFEASAETVRLQLMEGVRGQISGAVRFQRQEKNYRLSGNLSVSQGLVTRSFTKDFDDSERRLVAFQNPSVEQGPRRVINLNLSLATPEDVRLDTDKARVEAGATLRLTGTVDSPELSGVMSLRPDGSLMVGRNSFRVISARVDFDGFPRSPPALQASAVTKVGETVIQLEVDGEPNDLNIRLRAPENSSLTEGDLMSLLVTGRTLEDAGEGGQQIASTWAMSSFANLIHEGLGDVFSFGTPAAAGPLVLAEERNPTSRMTLGLPLTERFSITYSLPLDDPENQLWILDYRVAKDLWLRGIEESGTDYTLGFNHRFKLGRKRVLEESESGSRGQATARNVGRITFGGDHPLPEDELRKRLKIRSGARYDYWKAQDDANALRKSLIDKGFLSAVVEVQTEQEDQRVRLHFSVEAGKSTELVWKGDDPGSDIKKRTPSRLGWAAIPRELPRIRPGGARSLEAKEPTIFSGGGRRSGGKKTTVDSGLSSTCRRAHAVAGWRSSSRATSRFPTMNSETLCPRRHRQSCFPFSKPKNPSSQRVCASDTHRMGTSMPALESRGRPSILRPGSSESSSPSTRAPW